MQRDGHTVDKPSAVAAAILRVIACERAASAAVSAADAADNPIAFSRVRTGSRVSRLFAPAETRADRVVVSLECIGIADVSRVPQDLDARQQLDITGRAAG